MTARQLLAEYVARHNEGVHTGVFDTLIELFAEDAAFTFTGIDAGPFQGRSEIRRAFVENPLDDQLETRSSSTTAASRP